MRRIGFRHQRTLARPAEVAGAGFVTGARVCLRFRPAPAGAGVAFVRADLPGRPEIPADAAFVTGTQRRTTLGGPAGVTLVEHVLAALAGMRIDNCRIELDGPEPPGLDGSALGFVRAIVGAGAVLQSARREIWAPTERLALTDGGATISIDPPEAGTPPALRASYLLDYGPVGPIPRQAYTTTVTPETFARDLAACRTFLLEREADGLKAQGVGRHLTPADVLVFGPRGPVENRLRFADEPARHKLLDLVGDLSLCGFDLAGRLVAYRSGHALNARLAAELVAARRTWLPASRSALSVLRRAA